MANIDYAQVATGAVTGLVWDEIEEDYAPFVHVEIIGGTATYIAQTDIDGRYRIDSVPVGTYDARCINYGDTTYAEYNFKVLEDGIAFVNITIKQVELIVCFWAPPYKTPERPELNRKEIQQSTNRFQLQVLVSGITSNIQLNQENELQFQGYRNNGFLQLIDGVKTLEFSRIPSATLKHIMVYNGFIPARYGDTNGGVIVIETLSYFDLLNNRFPEE